MQFTSDNHFRCDTAILCNQHVSSARKSLLWNQLTQVNSISRAAAHWCHSNCYFMIAKSSDKRKIYSLMTTPVLHVCDWVHRHVWSQYQTAPDPDWPILESIFKIKLRSEKCWLSVASGPKQRENVDLISLVGLWSKAIWLLWYVYSSYEVMGTNV